MLARTKIVSELLTTQSHQKSLVQEAVALIHTDSSRYARLYKEEEYRLLSIDTIKGICLKYRLRFLDITYFKNPIPVHAQQELATLREEYGLALDSLKVIAPSEMFELEERDKDPILIADLGDGHYLYVDQWGGDIHRTRSILSWPFRTVATMFFTLTAVAFLLTSLLSFWVDNITTQIFFIAFFMVWMGLIGMGAYVVFAFRLNPSSMNWDSRFFD